MEIEPYKRIHTKEPKLKDIKQIRLESQELYKAWLNEINYLNYVVGKPAYCPIFPMVNCGS